MSKVLQRTLLKRQAVVVDVSVADGFVDEWHDGSQDQWQP
jgi:hypothetical protein